jgi:guanosine-3',5'-bis(diphosphate) 3'-pyrophosphohydrolase
LDQNRQLEKAIFLASHHHAGQTDKAGAPYILHPLAVMAMVDTPQQKVVAALHDIVEDTDLELYDLAAHGFPKAVVEAVAAITHKAGESNDDYYARVKKNPTALAVKLKDIAHNRGRLGNLEPATAIRLEKKYTHAIQELLTEKRES